MSPSPPEVYLPCRWSRQISHQPDRYCRKLRLPCVRRQRRPNLCESEPLSDRALAEQPRTITHSISICDGPRRPARGASQDTPSRIARGPWPARCLFCARHSPPSPPAFTRLASSPCHSIPPQPTSPPQPSSHPSPTIHPSLVVTLSARSNARCGRTVACVRKQIVRYQ